MLAAIVEVAASNHVQGTIGRPGGGANSICGRVLLCAQRGLDEGGKEGRDDQHDR